mgnify:CR=1 FL=1
MDKETYDCGIIGAGLAGLSTAILLSRLGYKVLVLEQKKFPMHKVCGEYVSMESYDFLENLGLPLSKMNLPMIRKVNISAPNGSMLSEELDLGGFGISRYWMDDLLAKKSVEFGTTLKENTKVFDVKYKDEGFEIFTNNGNYATKLCIGSFGKYPLFSMKHIKKSINYIGVKYHIKSDYIKRDVIELHNFKDGYCGVSAIEDGMACLCYLTTAENLKIHGNSIQELEKKVLMKNKYLKRIFERSVFLFDRPLVISNVTFESKRPVWNNILMVGDASGSIAPLCGNGMSMAFRGASILSELLIKFLNGQIDRNELHKIYNEKWQENFKTRIKAGFYLQKLFGRNLLTIIAISTLRYLPFISKRLIKLTHGHKF